MQVLNREIAEAAGASRADVVFVIDRVMHYHVDMLRSVEKGLAAHGLAFAVRSALDTAVAVGRVATREKVAADHRHFTLSEKLLGRFMLRYQHGLVDSLKALRPRVVVSTCHSGTVSEWMALHWARRAASRSTSTRVSASDSTNARTST